MLENMEELEEYFLFENDGVLLLLVCVLCQAALERAILNLRHYMIRLQLKSIRVPLTI